MEVNKQRTMWRNSDEVVLIDLWRERAGDLRRAKRNFHIYADISVQMAHKFTPKEVHIKIRNLTQKYREERKKVGPSGGSPSLWKHFDAVHQIIGLTVTNTAEVHESFTVSSMAIGSPEPISPEPEPMSPEPEPMSPEPVCTPVMTLTNSPLMSPPGSSTSAAGASANKKRNYMGELVKVAKEQNELLKTVVEDGKILTERVVTAIEEQSNNTKEFIGIMKNILEKM
ncbi:uncharacterized protein LOC125776874 [Bactrocera dorsalis]|uniref:Uncharacterized protein LOC125776874 n=1 Tax=Bactrocera dorsalis TaxID=27457 RepID=A0ABM3JBH0_BACDO|nr:uncharacterized protein LOC125776874 [Bactrocera dorsalis]